MSSSAASPVKLEPLLYWKDSSAEYCRETEAVHHTLPVWPCFDHTALVADALVARAMTVSVPIVVPYMWYQKEALTTAWHALFMYLSSKRSFVRAGDDDSAYM